MSRPVIHANRPHLQHVLPSDALSQRLALCRRPMFASDGSSKQQPTFAVTATVGVKQQPRTREAENAKRFTIGGEVAARYSGALAPPNGSQVIPVAAVAVTGEASRCSSLASA
ncbi:hypothetical protein MTO96_007938 [Rhipicephalus appendiculatus]